MTQLEAALQGAVTNEMKAILDHEPLSEKELLKGIIEGRIVIPCNKNHDLQHLRAIGEGCYTKINTNIGTSASCQDQGMEREKLKVALECGTDAVMDLSTGGNISSMRSFLRGNCPVPFGTVPVYQVAVNLLQQNKKIEEMTAREMIEVIVQNANDGVDFITIHSGLTLEIARRIESGTYNRLMPSVSRGGALLLRWMRANNKENPFYEHYDEILDICREFDVTISLGDGLRPGCLKDATDNAQIAELNVLGELHMRALKSGVQSMVEGPGHVPLSEIKANVQLEKKLCHGAPFYVLGPIVTDIAPGYDHITAAIGGAVAGAAGADFLCYVTPAEHLRIPDIDDVRNGVIASRIAAHVADLEKKIGNAQEWDDKMAQARKDLDWETMFKLSVDPVKARTYRALDASDIKECTMCEALCSVKQMTEEE